MTPIATTPRRSLADWCIRTARAVLPAPRTEWAEAMDAEVAAITDDREALRWAVGCLITSCLIHLRDRRYRPSAYLPLVMSSIAIGMVLIHAALYGIVPETDEGTPAHIFQLLMVAQVPVIAFFALRWFREAPASTTRILLVQFVAMGGAVVSVLLFT